MAAAIPYILMAAGTAVSAYSQYKSAKIQAEESEYKTQKLEREKRFMFARQRTAYAKSGVMLTEGSPLAVMADTATQYEMDIRMQRRQTKAIKQVGYLKAGSTILTGLSAMSGGWKVSPAKQTVISGTGSNVGPAKAGGFARLTE